MPGQIKIDDGAGNYTVLTNGGSLGSDKTITIPNTTGTMALTSDIVADTKGLEAAQQFRLTTTVSADTTPLTAYEVPDTSNQGNLGSLVSVSSGVFSFSETGFYEVEFTAYYYTPNSSGYASVFIQSTLDDGSNWTTIANNYHEGAGGYTGAYNSNKAIVDITDVSQQKIRINYDFGSGSVQLRGSTDTNQSNVVFKKLGDT